MEAHFVTNGARCALESCNQFTFLPFTCGDCSKKFCDDHRLCDEHDCTGKVDDGFVPVCPKCSNPVPMERGQDRDTVIQAHLSRGCAQSTLVPNSRPCGVKECRSKHPFKVSCQACHALFRLSHRLPEEHSCPVPAEKDPLPDPKKKAATRALLGLSKAKQPQAVVGPTNVHQDDRIEFAVYFPQALGVKHQKVVMPRRWSVGKVVDWLCEKYRLGATAQKRFRLIITTATADAVAVVPNHMTLQQSGTTKDDGTRLPGLTGGVILVPEEWLSNPPSPPRSPTTAPRSPGRPLTPCSVEERLLALVQHEAPHVVRCNAI